MTKKKIILVGGGGHCKSCIEVIESTGSYQVEGILDVQEKLHQKILNYTIIGTDENIEELARSGHSFLVTAGQIKTSSIRKKLFQIIKDAGGKCETVVANTARVSQYASLGEGSIIMHNAFVNADVQIGDNCIVNTHAVIEHDVTVSNHTQISTMAVLNGGVVIGSDSFIGSNAVINQYLTIGDDVIIGSGSVINKDIIEKGIYAGNPFKKISG
jgi:sugar O-acyltransferase (sialic acid O-acetyltransferase NeuD family)